MDGFVGGSCADATVRLQALRVLETGEPVLVRIVPGDQERVSRPGQAVAEVFDSGRCPRWVRRSANLDHCLEVVVIRGTRDREPRNCMHVMFSFGEVGTYR